MKFTSIVTVLGATLLRVACAQDTATSLEPAVQTSSAASSTQSTSASASKTTPATPAAPPAKPVSAATAAATKSKGAPDRLELNSSQVTGNRELPRVMYVVPWHRPDVGDAVGRPPNSLLDEALTPVDREVFRRQNSYYAALNSAAGTQGAPAAAGARGSDAATPASQDPATTPVAADPAVRDEK